MSSCERWSREPGTPVGVHTGPVIIGFDGTRAAQLATNAGMRAEGLAVADEVSVADTFVRLARERDAGAVVVGAHRHSRVAELVLGTTTRGVIDKAPCPVVVVRERHADRTEPRSPNGR
jgi:nucleotide-binding universal stress UspA family protein